MRAFRYRLAPVLKRAQHIEQVLQIELARLQEQLARALERLEALRQVRDALHVRLRRLHAAERLPTLGREPSPGVDLARVHSIRRELDYVDAVLARAALLRRELEKRAAAARSRLLEAARSRQLFQNHRDHLAVQHRRGELAAETKHLDELATTSFANRRGPPADAAAPQPPAEPPPEPSSERRLAAQPPPSPGSRASADRRASPGRRASSGGSP